VTWLEPVVLEGQHVRLEPLGPHHVDGLWGASDPSLWTYMPFSVASRDDVAALVEFVPMVGLGFATIDRATDAIVGSTSFLAPNETNRCVEIGATWVTPSRQRTVINTEAKLLQLTHAFEALECARVEFKTDARNVRSRAALARIGAVEEGVLRKHMVMPDGHWRDSVFFSILDTEWPGVRGRLEEMIVR
jgi:RimJ/RimL family protein N-acetyltransferase